MSLGGNFLLENDIRSIFKQLDVDGNGYIGAPDLIRVLKGIGEEADDELVDAMLSSVDVDGDGQISYAEFRGLVKLLEQERGGLRPKGYEPRRELMQGDIPPASVKSRKGRRESDDSSSGTGTDSDSN